MWLTTSKNAPADLKKQARALADALPGVEFVPRGERSLERLEILAQRKGEKALCVMMVFDEGDKRGVKAGKTKKPDNLLTIRSRHLQKDEEGASRWAWSKSALEVGKLVVKNQKSLGTLGDDPYIFSANGDGKKLAEFLGLENHPLVEFTDEPAMIALEARKSKTAAKVGAKSLFIASFGAEHLLELEYIWVD